MERSVRTRSSGSSRPVANRSITCGPRRASDQGDARASATHHGRLPGDRRLRGRRDRADHDAEDLRVSARGAPEDDDGARPASRAQGSGPPCCQAHEGLAGVSHARGEGRAHAGGPRGESAYDTRGHRGHARADQVAVPTIPSARSGWTQASGSFVPLTTRVPVTATVHRLQRMCARAARARDVRVLIDQASSSRCTRRSQTAACATSTSTASTGDGRHDRSPSTSRRSTASCRMCCHAEDFRFRVERHMATTHAENGDRVSRSSWSARS